MDYLFKKLTENIKKYDKIIIMTHKHPDLDGMGSAICLYSIITSMKRDCGIVFPADKINKSLDKGIKYLKDNNVDVNFVSDVIMDDDTLLIVLDTQKPSLVEREELLLGSNVFVIDHHTNSSVHISNTVFEYIDSNKSSVAEVMVEYLKYLDKSVCPEIATILMCGMDIDTHSFSMKTTDRTFACASILSRMGASSEVKNEILKESLDDVVRRQEHIKESYFIKEGFLLCDMGDDVEDVVDLAIMADELLRLDGVQVSFVIGKFKDGVRVSARSLGKVSVEVIMSALGGGGHVTDAAASFKDKSNSEVASMIKNVVMEG